MERLGLGWETLHAEHPRLVMLSITGFGSSGPYAGQRVYDTVIQAVSGMADAHPDEQTGEPRLLRTLMCDKVTALTAAQAVTAALLARAGDGCGRLVEVNMLDAAVAFLWPEAFYNHAFLDEPPAPVDRDLADRPVRLPLRSGLVGPAPVTGRLSGRDRRFARAGHHHFAHVGARGVGEVHERLHFRTLQRFFRNPSSEPERLKDAAMLPSRISWISR